MNILTMKKKPFLLVLTLSLGWQCLGWQSASLSIAKEAVESAKIFGCSVGAACLDGLIYDQVTVRVCPEYFTEGFHRSMIRSNVFSGAMSKKFGDKLLDSKNKTLIGMFWGVAATWWVGAGLGVPLTLAARLGFSQKVRVNDLARPLAVGMAALSGASLGAGLYGYFKAKNETDPYPITRKYMYVAGNTPGESMNRYIANAYVHETGYGAGALVGLGLIGYTLSKRFKK